MATKPKNTVKPKMLARKSPELLLEEEATEKENAEKYAKLLASPEFAAYRVIRSADGKTETYADIDIPSLMNEFRTQSAAANRGDFTQAEAMLMNQATALQTLFSNLVERANFQNTIQNIEGFMRMALRAQNQCRATLETLAAIKNPPIVFAKQANINHGNQQVNNGAPAADTSRTGKTINQQSELLTKGSTHETLDTRGTSEAIPANPAMATLD
jgi:hypothetical protein